MPRAMTQAASRRHPQKRMMPKCKRLSARHIGGAKSEGRCAKKDCFAFSRTTDDRFFEDKNWKSPNPTSPGKCQTAAPKHSKTLSGEASL